MERRDKGIYDRGMADKPTKKTAFFFRAWRKHRGLTQEGLAAATGLTPASISQIETGEQGFSVPTLIALSGALNCLPGDLLSRGPKDIDAIWSAWSAIPSERRDQALAVLKTFAGPKAEPPPSPQPPPAAPSNRVTPRFKEQPALPTIGQGGTIHYYLLDWMDHRNMEPEDLVKRLPDWSLEDLKRVLAGRFEPPADLVHYAAKALRTTEEKLRELPPAPAPKPAKTGKKAAKR